MRSNHDGRYPPDRGPLLKDSAVSQTTLQSVLSSARYSNNSRRTNFKLFMNHARDVQIEVDE